MAERKEYELTQEQYDKMLSDISVARNTSGMFLSGGQPMSNVQETANRLWVKLGEEMGFDGMSVKPVSGSKLKFTAIPTEKGNEQGSD